MTKKPPETAPNPAWAGSGKPPATGNTMHESSRRTEGGSQGKNILGRKTAHAERFGFTLKTRMHH